MKVDYSTGIQPCKKSLLKLLKRGQKNDACRKIVIFQYPKGHWSFVAENSEFGICLTSTGIINGVVAKQWELLDRDTFDFEKEIKKLK